VLNSSDLLLLTPSITVNVAKRPRHSSLALVQRLHRAAGLARVDDPDKAVYLRADALTKKLGVAGDVLLNRLGRLTGDPFDVVSRAVVPVLAVQPCQRGDVLLGVHGQADRHEGVRKPVES
jgi:adenylate cyclase regulatory protein